MVLVQFAAVAVKLRSLDTDIVDVAAATAAGYVRGQRVGVFSWNWVSVHVVRSAVVRSAVVRWCAAAVHWYI